MRRIDSIEDQMRGVAVYELANGQRVRIDARAVRELGISAILRDMGLEDQIPAERVIVTQHGRKIGTVPGDFDPLFIKSKNYFYDPRPGDFIREGDVWIASRMLGPGDLAAVPGFIWDHSEQQRIRSDD